MSETLKYLDRPFTVIERPLPWQLRGLQQTSSGYGGKLTSTRMIQIEGEKRPRRLYIMCYSNSGTAYVLIKGEQYIVRDSDLM